MLPYNMTVYQAIRQFSPLAHDQSETDTDTETPIGKFFVQNFMLSRKVIYMKNKITTLFLRNFCRKCINLGATTHHLLPTRTTKPDSEGRVSIWI